MLQLFTFSKAWMTPDDSFGVTLTAKDTIGLITKLNPSTYNSLYQQIEPILGITAAVNTSANILLDLVKINIVVSWNLLSA